MPTGAVLCGGSSRRMGRDKALVHVLGEAMASRVAATLRVAGCDPVVAVGGDSHAVGELGIPFVADDHPGEGPLGAVITALRHHARLASELDDVAVIVACDLPWLTPTTVLRLIAAVEDGDVALAVGERQQPLCAAWRLDCLPALDRRYMNGERSMHAVLPDLTVVEVAVEGVDLANVNTPADLPTDPPATSG